VFGDDYPNRATNFYLRPIAFRLSPAISMCLVEINEEASKSYNNLLEGFIMWFL